MTTVSQLHTTSSKSSADIAESVIASARDMVPDLRARCKEIDTLGKLPGDIVERMSAAGLFKLTIPQIYGGLQMGPATYRKVIAELARGDMSVGWTASLMNTANWLLAAALPKEVADEIFALPGGPRPSGGLAPRHIKVRKASGGYVIEDGLWGFASGVYHSNLSVLGMPLLDDAGNAVDQALALVPNAKVTILNDWDTIGMRGTGSSSVSVRDVFVPDTHIVPFTPLVQGRYQSTYLEKIPIYRLALMPMMAISLVYPLVGGARAALEIFLERLPRRGIKYTSYEKQGEAAVTHLQLSEVDAKIDAAELFIQRSTETLERVAQAGEKMPPFDRARCRRDAG
ncbi:MAG: acyl-CoA dehydrogenase family protein, partial [Dongiaceae bacterium]